ncbi:MAG: mechanosensitive ion channel family protein [Deltaproteobacteria bacterium]|nr:mechanosensitive ion channel family protein [Deltaproteobacteria bacterium]
MSLPEGLGWLGLELGGNPLWRWIAAVLVVCAIFGAVWVVRRVVIRRLVAWAHRSSTDLDDVVVSPVKATSPLLLGIVALVSGARVLALPEGARHVLGVVTLVAVALQLGAWAQAIGRAVIEAWGRRQQRDGSGTVVAGLRFAVRAAVWTLVLLVVLANLGVRVDALLAGLGVGGVAAALAVQNVLGDVFASLAVYFDRPFDLGDFVVVGDVSGTVSAIGIRSTQIRALSGERIVFPNAKLAASTIRNFRRMDERRVVLAIGLTYGTAPAKLREATTLVRTAIEAEEGVRFERVHLKGFGAFSLDLEAVYHVLSREYGVFMDRQHEINLRIMEAFERSGLDFAFPTQTLHVDGMPRVLDACLETLARGRAQTSAPPK